MNDLATIIELKNLISQACFDLGLNTAHDYDGVQTNEDLIIYTKAIIRKAKKKNEK